VVRSRPGRPLPALKGELPVSCRFATKAAAAAVFVVPNLCLGAERRVREVRERRLTVGLAADPKAEVGTVWIVDAKLARSFIPGVLPSAPYVCHVDFSTHRFLHYDPGLPRFPRAVALGSVGLRPCTCATPRHRQSASIASPASGRPDASTAARTDLGLIEEAFLKEVRGGLA
jgi:hypothetical protein